MVARSASAAPRFVPGEHPRVAVAHDGTLAAIVESTRVAILDLPACSELAELGIDPEAGACDVAWIGARLAVLSRYAAHSVVHLVDPRGPSGPRTVAEIRLEAPMRLYAAVGTHALAVGSLGTAVLTAGDSHLTPYQFPARTVPVAAGVAGSQFVVALAGGGGGLIEEWDPHARMPRRRLKLGRSAAITAVGGSERVVWMTTQADPTRLDVFTFVNRGQPKVHELPEPIAHVASHPRSDLVVCLGADTGRLFLVDLDGKHAMRTLGPEGIDRAEGSGLIVGRMVGVLAAQARRPVAIVVLEGHEVTSRTHAALPAVDPTPDPDDSERSTLADDEPPVPEPEPAPPTPPAPAPAARKPSLHRVAKLGTASSSSSPPPVAPATPPPPMSQNLASKFAAWRSRTRAVAQPARAPASPVHALGERRRSWRDELHSWARGVAAGAVDREPPTAPLVEQIRARFELAPALIPAIALLYGAHLAGEPGAAPIDIARVLGRQWDDALGRGQLAATGVATYRDSRVRLAIGVVRALDELGPATGALVGTAGTTTLLGPCVVVAHGPLGVVAEAYLPLVGGAILAARDGAEVDDVLVEARAYGAVALVRAPSLATRSIPLIVAVDDDAAADALGVPRLA